MKFYKVVRVGERGRDENESHYRPLMRIILICIRYMLAPLFFLLAPNDQIRGRTFGYKNGLPYAKSVLDKTRNCGIILPIPTRNMIMLHLTFFALLILFVVACMAALLSTIMQFYVGTLFAIGYMVITGYAMQKIHDLILK